MPRSTGYVIISVITKQIKKALTLQKTKKNQMTITLKHGSSKSKVKKLMEELLKRKSSKGVDTKKYCGVLSLNADALNLQKQWRDEWK